MDNLSSDWLDLLRDEASLTKELRKIISEPVFKQTLIGKTPVKADVLLQIVARQAATKLGFDTEFVYDIEVDATYEISDVVNKIVSNYKINRVFLHEKPM